MSDILIKGVDMPGFCIDCPCGHVDNSEYPKQKLFCYGQYECPELDINEVRNKVKNCPLVEVPTPHGRLIDADKVLSEIREIVKADTERGKITFAVDIFRPINNAPTVIDAEE